MFHFALTRQDWPQGHPAEPDPVARLVACRSRYLSYLRRRVGNAAVAEDLLQDFSLKVIRASRHAAPGRNTDAWLARVLRNTLFDHYRRRDAHRRAEDAYASDALALGEPAGPEPEPGSDAPSDDVALVEAALSAIRPDHANLLRMLYLDGQSRDSLARDMAIETGTLNVRVFRARAALRAALDRLRDKPTAGPERPGKAASPATAAHHPGRGLQQQDLETRRAA